MIVIFFQNIFSYTKYIYLRIFEQYSKKLSENMYKKISVYLVFTLEI